MKDRIVELIAQVNGDPALTARADGSSHLVNDLRVDSLNLVSLILLIESEFDIEVELDDFSADHVESLDRFVDFIASHA